MDEHFHTWLGHQGPIEIRLFGFNVVSRVTNASLTTQPLMQISCIRVGGMSTTKFAMNLHWLMLELDLYTLRGIEKVNEFFWVFIHSYMHLLIIEHTL
jgi:hypothetical protein